VRQACGLDAFIRAGAGPERRRTIGAGQTIEYEQLSGRAFGELDPRAPLNSLIQNIELGRDKDGKVRYTASFVLTRPKNMNQASGLLWHDVPNRGRSVLIAVMAKQDPRLSLEERYGSHANYVARVRQAAANAVARGFLLQPDADALIAEAEASKVLR